MRKLQWCNGVLNSQDIGVDEGECVDEGVGVGNCQGVGVALIRVRRKEEGGGRRKVSWVRRGRGKGIE